VLDRTQFSCSDVGSSFTVTATATDTSGNLATDDVLVSVVDTTAPTVVSVGTFNVTLNSTGLATVAVASLVSSALDNCNVDVVSANSTTFGCDSTGHNPVSLRAIDPSGNFDETVVVVNVIDQELPTLTVVDDITVALLPNGTYSMRHSDAVTSAGDNCAVDRIELSRYSYSCSDVGSNFTVLASIFDVSGNIFSRNFTAAVVDQVGPSIVTVDPFDVYLNAAGNITVATSHLVNITNDNCGIASTQANQTTFSCQDLGVRPVEVTTVDLSSNQASALSSVRVFDAIAPAVLANTGLIVTLDGSGGAQLLPQDAVNASHDNCGVEALALNRTALTCLDVFAPQPLLLIANDSSGNEGYDTFSITVRDIDLPIIASISPLNISLDSSGSITLNVSELIAVATDNCGVDVSATKLTFTCGDIGANIVTLTAIDPSGNTVNTTAIVYVADTESPSLTVRDNYTVSVNTNGTYDLVVSEIVNSTADNCHVADVALDLSHFNCSDVFGVFPVNATVTDTSSNTAMATTLVSIVDLVFPAVESVGTYNVSLNAMGTGAAPVGVLVSSASDNCGVAVAANQTSFTCADLGLRPILLTATDPSGNEVTDSVVVSVADEIMPFVQSSGNFTIDLDVNGVASTTVNSRLGVATDNCAVSSVTLDKYSFNCSDVGVIPITLTAVDQSGNAASDVAYASVFDVTPPAFTTKLSFTLYVGIAGQAVLSPSSLVLASDDACGVAYAEVDRPLWNCTHVQDDAYPVVVTVYDVNGLSSSRTVPVFVRDRTDPTFVSDPFDVVLDAFGRATATPFANDSCGVRSVVSNPAEITCDDVGTIDVQVLVVDVNGNSKSGSVNVTVLDLEDPVLITNDNFFALDSSGLHLLLAGEVVASATDNCGVSSTDLSKELFSCSDVSSSPNLVTITIVDPSGNYDVETAFVTVFDDEDPYFVAEEEYVVALDGNGTYTLDVQEVASLATDNCGVDSMFLDRSAFSCADVFVNVTVEATAVDIFNNTLNQTTRIRTVDNIPPVVVSVGALNISLNASGAFGVSVSALVASSADNCGVSVVANQTLFGCVDVGIAQVALVAFDPSMNTAETLVAVNVLDDEKPIVTTVADFEVALDPAGSYALTVGEAVNATSDNCGVQSVLLDETLFSCSDVGSSILVTATAVDTVGNEGTSTVTVTVSDVTAPNISSVGSFTASLSSIGSVMVNVASLVAASYDNCGVSVSASQTFFSCADVGDNFVTLVATDPSLNNQTANVSVLIVDVDQPIVTMAAPFEIAVNASGTFALPVSQAVANVTDNCAPVALVQLDRTTFSCSDVNDVIVITATAQDQSNNTGTGSVVVTVRDQLSPTITVLASTTAVLNDLGRSNVTKEAVVLSATDNCNVTVRPAAHEFSCADVGAQIVSFEASDAAGNTASELVSVLVRDLTAPHLVEQMALNVLLNETGYVTISAADAVISMDDACGIRSVELGTSVFSCLDAGLVRNISVVATDVNNNTARRFVDVAVADDVQPTLTLKQSFALQVGLLGFATLLPSDVILSDGDACGIAMRNVSISRFDCTDVRETPYVVTVTVTDTNGNAQSGDVDVYVRDSEDPYLVMNNLVYDLDASGQAFVDPNTTDACGVKTEVLSQRRFGCNDLGLHRLDLLVADNDGNSFDVVLNVTIRDTSVPIVNPVANFDLPLDVVGAASVGFDDIVASDSDNCAVSTRQISRALFSCADVGPNVVAATVTDHVNLTTTVTTVVTIVDDIPPTMASRNIVRALNSTGRVSITPVEVDNGTTDNCAVVDLYLNTTAFSCADQGDNVVQLSALDSASLTNATLAIVTVIDAENPSIAIRENITVTLDAVGAATFGAGDVILAQDDNCGIVSRNLSRELASCIDVGILNVSVSVSDLAGNVATKYFLAHVEDVDHPNVTVNGSILRTLNSTGAFEIAVVDVELTATDNCPIASRDFNKAVFTCADVGIQLVNYTVTDTSGLSSTRPFTLNIADDEDPQLLLRTAVNVTLSPSSGLASLNASAHVNQASDNCGIAAVLADKTVFSCADVGVVPVVVSVIDINSRVVQQVSNVTVRDLAMPQVVYNAIVTLPLEANGTALLNVGDVLVSATDNCGIATTELNRTAFSCVDANLDTPVLLTVTDVNGVVTTKNVVIRVVDRVSPDVSFSTAVVQLGASGTVFLPASLIDGGSMDACGVNNVSVAPNTFSCSDVGSVGVTLTVTDLFGNEANVTGTITIVDATPPTVLSAPQNVSLNESGIVSLLPATVDAGSADACGVAQLTLDKTLFSCADVAVSPVTITLTVTDVNGNNDSATALVSVTDAVLPVAVPRNVLVALNASGTATLLPADVDDGSTDNCMVAGLALDVTTFTCADLGANVIELSVTDSSGNVGTALAQADVVDLIAPGVRTRNDTLVLADDGQITITPGVVDSGSIDACGPLSLAVDRTSFTCADVGGPVEVTLTGTDGSGNTANTSAYLTLQDQTNPLVVTQNLTVGLNASGLFYAAASSANGGSSDACGIASFSLNKNLFTCSDVSSIPQSITLTVTDVNGNSAGASLSVLVSDNVAPTVVAFSSRAFDLATDGVHTLVPAALNNGSTDACGVQALAASPPSLGCADVGAPVAVVLEVTDVNGNSNSATVMVSVSDVTPPVVLVENRALPLDASGSKTTEPSQIDNGSSDACGVTLDITDATYTCADVGASFVLNLTATDPSGLSATEAATVTVVDITPPAVAIASNLTWQLLPEPLWSLNLTVANFTANLTDACGVADFQVSQTYFNCSDVGVRELNYTATDVNGNVNVVPFNVTIRDNDCPFPVDCVVAENFTLTTECSLTCGGKGFYIEQRLILVEPEFGGEPCPAGIVQSRECITPACPDSTQFVVSATLVFAIDFNTLTDTDIENLRLALCDLLAGDVTCEQVEIVSVTEGSTIVVVRVNAIPDVPTVEAVEKKLTSLRANFDAKLGTYSVAVAPRTSSTISEKESGFYIAGIVLVILALLILIVGALYIRYRQKRKETAKVQTPGTRGQYSRRSGPVNVPARGAMPPTAWDEIKLDVNEGKKGRDQAALLSNADASGPTDMTPLSRRSRELSFLQKLGQDLGWRKNRTQVGDIPGTGAPSLPQVTPLSSNNGVPFPQLPKPGAGASGMPARPMMQFPAPHRGSVPAFNRPLLTTDARNRVGILPSRASPSMPRRPVLPSGASDPLDPAGVAFPAPPKPPTFTDPFSSDKRKRFPTSLPPPIMPGRPGGTLPRPPQMPRTRGNAPMFEDMKLKSPSRVIGDAQ
jgi:hypothetical protein